MDCTVARETATLRVLVRLGTKLTPLFLDPPDSLSKASVYT